MGKVRTGALGTFDWLSGCFYNASKNRCKKLNSYAKQYDFKKAPIMGVHVLALTALGVGYGSASLGKWCIEKGFTTENCYKAKVFGQNVLTRGRELIANRPYRVTYTREEILEREARKQYMLDTNATPQPQAPQAYKSEEPIQIEEEVITVPQQAPAQAPEEEDFTLPTPEELGIEDNIVDVEFTEEEDDLASGTTNIFGD